MQPMQHTDYDPTTPTNMDGRPRYDERATEIVERHIENATLSNGEYLSDMVRAIIQRAYLDAEEARREDPEAITAPRADAGDALREFFDEHNPLYEDGGIWLTLLDFALDRCDWYAIVDHQRARMEENRRAELAEQDESEEECTDCDGKGYEQFGPLKLNCAACHGTGLARGSQTAHE